MVGVHKQPGGQLIPVWSLSDVKSAEIDSILAAKQKPYRKQTRLIEKMRPPLHVTVEPEAGSLRWIHGVVVPNYVDS